MLCSRNLHQTEVKELGWQLMVHEEIDVCMRLNLQQPDNERI